MVSNLLTVALVVASCSDAFAQHHYNPSNNQRQQPTSHPYHYKPSNNNLRHVSNPNGGVDARIQAVTGVGTPDHNVIGSAFAAGNTLGKGPVATGGSLEYNLNGHGVSLTKEHIPGVRDTLTQNAKVNLFNDGTHKLDANAFKSENTLANGFQFDKTGGRLDYNHLNGHGASAGVSSIPNFGKTYDIMARGNLWQSQDRNTRLDLTGTGSKTVGGPFDGQKNFGANLGLTHFFG